MGGWDLQLNAGCYYILSIGIIKKFYTRNLKINKKIEPLKAPY